MLTPNPPPRDAGPPGVGWVNICFIDFLDIHGSHWHWLIEGSENDVITSTDSLWRHLPHNGSQKKLAAKSRFGDWPQWPHASRPFMGPIFGRNHSQVYPHMRAKFGHDRSSSLAACTWQTDTQNLYYIDTSWIPGFARGPLSRSLSPSLSRPSLLFVPAFYPPSLGLPGFAQDNWSLVTLKFSPLTPPLPPSDGVGWGLHVLVIFSVEFFFLSIFSAVREISRTFEMLTPNPPPGTLDPPGWGG